MLLRPSALSDRVSLILGMLQSSYRAIYGLLLSCDGLLEQFLLGPQIGGLDPAAVFHNGAPAQLSLLLSQEIESPLLRLQSRLRVVEVSLSLDKEFWLGCEMLGVPFAGDVTGFRARTQMFGWRRCRTCQGAKGYDPSPHSAGAFHLLTRFLTSEHDSAKPRRWPACSPSIKIQIAIGDPIKSEERAQS